MVYLVYFLKILLFPGYLFGPGALIQKILKHRVRISHAMALSLSFWSIIGWFTFNHLDQTVLIFSMIGYIGLFFIDYEREYKFLLYIIGITLLRFFIISFLTMPYGCDTIMHAYTVYSIHSANGYTNTFLPFGVSGLGIFNIGFHFIASEIQYLLGISSLNATIFAGYLFFSLLFIAINEFIQKPFLSGLILFTLVRPANFLAWGGFPTLASIAFAMIAFKYPPPYSYFFWIGAFSTHFIPAAAAFLPYFFKHFKKKVTFIYGFIMAGILFSQYYRIIYLNLKFSGNENSAIDRYIL